MWSLVSWRCINFTLFLQCYVYDSSASKTIWSKELSFLISNLLQTTIFVKYNNNKLPKSEIKKTYKIQAHIIIFHIYTYVFRANIKERKITKPIHTVHGKRAYRQLI